MKLSTWLLGLLISTSALASMQVKIGDWYVEFIKPDGSYEMVGEYVSKAACEAAIPDAIKEHGGGYNGHCVEEKNGKLIGSQNPNPPTPAPPSVSRPPPPPLGPPTGDVPNPRPPSAHL